MSDEFIPNSVNRRLLSVQEDWLSFAKNKDARLLYWQIPEEDDALLATYLQLQAEKASGLIAFNHAFVAARQYTRDIVDGLIEFYELRREGSAQNGIVADWRPPSADNPSSLDYFFTLTDSLIEYHPEIFPALVFVFRPIAVSERTQFVGWFSELLSAAKRSRLSKDKVRFMLYGEDGSAFNELDEAAKSAFVLINRRYFTDNIPREMVAQSTEGGPQGSFRRLFIALTETLKNNDPQRLAKLRANALAITEEQKWFDQSVVVHLIAGAAYLKWQDYAKSIEAYRQGIEAGYRALAANHPAGNKLVANALFGEASVYVSQKEYVLAAECYERIVPYTTAAEDTILTVEAWRMSSFCREQAKQRERALQSAFAALDVGLLMDDTLRRNSSLPFAAAWLYEALSSADDSNLSDGDGQDDDQRMVDTFTQLYGENWLAVIKPAHSDKPAV